MFSSTSWDVPPNAFTVLCFHEHRGMFLHIEYARREYRFDPDLAIWVTQPFNLAGALDSCPRTSMADSEAWPSRVFRPVGDSSFVFGLFSVCFRIPVLCFQHSTRFVPSESPPSSANVPGIARVPARSLYCRLLIGDWKEIPSPGGLQSAIDNRQSIAGGTPALPDLPRTVWRTGVLRTTSNPSALCRRAMPLIGSVGQRAIGWYTLYSSTHYSTISTRVKKNICGPGSIHWRASNLGPRGGPGAAARRPKEHAHREGPGGVTVNRRGGAGENILLDVS